MEADKVNELVDKVNTNFDESRKEFCDFVGRKSKGKKNNNYYWLH